jgi:hypothetical protein
MVTAFHSCSNNVTVSDVTWESYLGGVDNNATGILGPPRISSGPLIKEIVLGTFDHTGFERVVVRPGRGIAT